MNRFLLAQTLNSEDSLVWYRKRPDGTTWECHWSYQNTPECNRTVTFVAIIPDTQKVVKVFTIYLDPPRSAKHVRSL